MKLDGALAFFRSAKSYRSPKDRLKRAFDFGLAAVLLPPAGILMLGIWGAIRLTSRGAGIYWSDRVGQHNHIFKMPKFRTMKEEAPTVATHLLNNPDAWVTPVGRVLRKYSLDELPQLFCVLKGNMSFVGPRPALFNQHDLIDLRTRKGIHELLPGITGWAQVNGRDELPIPVKVAYEEQYLREQSFRLDLRILAMTVLQVFQSRGVSH